MSVNLDSCLQMLQCITKQSIPVHIYIYKYVYICRESKISPPPLLHTDTFIQIPLLTYSCFNALLRGIDIRQGDSGELTGRFWRADSEILESWQGDSKECTMKILKTDMKISESWHGDSGELTGRFWKVYNEILEIWRRFWKADKEILEGWKRDSWELTERLWRIWS